MPEGEPRFLVATPYPEGSINAVARAASEKGVLDGYITTLGLGGLHLEVFGRVGGRRWTHAVTRRALAGLGSAQVLELARPSEVLHGAIRAAKARRLAPGAMYWAKHRFDLATARWLARRTSDQLPDAIVGMHGSSSATFAVARRRGVLTVLNVVNSMPDTHNRLIRLHGGPTVPTHEFVGRRHARRVVDEVRRSDLLLAPSEFIAEQLRPLTTGEVLVTPYGVDLDTFQPAARRPPRQRLQVMAVGQISYRKGVPTLAQVARLTGDIADFLVVGPLTDKRLLRDLPDNLTYRPSMPHTELAAALADSDILALLSYEDAYGLVVAESLACGTPVIVTATSGSSERVTDGENGFVVPSGAPEQTATLIRRQAADPDNLHAMRSRARASVLDQGDWTEFGRRVLQRVSSASVKSSGAGNGS